METHFKLFILLSVSCLCDGHLKLFDIVAGAHQHIHDKVHYVAGSVLGGFTRRPVQQGPTHGEQETVVVVVEETNQGGQGQGTPNYGYNPNQGHNHFPHQQGNYGQTHQQNGQNYALNYGNGNNGPVQNFPGNQHQNEHGNQNQGGHGNNQNEYENNNMQGGYGNGGNPNNNDGQNNNGYNNKKPNQNENEFTRPEQNKPNLNDNYKPMETNDGQNDAHKTEYAHKETNDKTTKKPVNDEPLLVPLNDYTYQGDKISVNNAPKRETDKIGTPAEDSDEQFPIDIRFKEE